MPAKKATKTATKTEAKVTPAQPQTGTPQKFVVTGAPIKTKEAQKRDANKGKEPWRHKLVSGSAHPDNKPPVTIIAQASDDAKEKYEASINNEREKAFAPGTDWRDLEGGVPADESNAEEAKFPRGAREASNP